MSAVAIFCAVIGALIRDVRFVIPVLIQVGFIATPVMYPRSLVPSRYAWVYDLNPLAWIIEAVRAAVILGQWPSLALIGALLLAGIVLLAVAIAYSAAVEDRLPDLL
jgi:lipopolysaccharide transport system permease protein